MEPGGIEFIDDDGAAVAPDRRDDLPTREPGRTRRTRGPVLALVLAVLVVGGGVLWNEHGKSAKQPRSAPVAPVRVITVHPEPPGGLAVDGGIHPTGELLAEARRKQRQAQEQLHCMTRVQTELERMDAAYQSALATGDSHREAERAAHAVLADLPDRGVAGAAYDAMFRIWRINRTALAEQSGQRLSIDMTALCPT